MLAHQGLPGGFVQLGQAELHIAKRHASTPAGQCKQQAAQAPAQPGLPGQRQPLQDPQQAQHGPGQRTLHHGTASSPVTACTRRGCL